MVTDNREECVATLGIEPTTTVQEQEMAQEVTAVEQQAGAIVIRNNDDYTQAAEFGKLIKQKAAQITEFFAPMKKAAHDAHANICAREKASLAPLVAAEKLVKKVMGEYVMEQERKRREEEERARKAAQEEADRKLAEAMACESKGDKVGAENAMMAASIVDEASRNIVVDAPTPKAGGVSSGVDWEIVSIDDGKVPVEIQGMVIRPVDKAMVTRLIRASKGKIKIPGVEYKEVAKLSFRK